MDEATEGVVYVSFGSVLQGALVPKDKQEALLNGIFYAGKNISYLESVMATFDFVKMSNFAIHTG